MTQAAAQCQATNPRCRVDSAGDCQTVNMGGAVYIAAAYLLRISELQEVLAFLRGRFRRAPVVTEGA